MEDGQQSKIAFIIQARMQSSRLPGKILLPIPLNDGKPLIQWIIEELRKSVHDADIYVATSENKENDILEAFCAEHKILCFRGSEEDVLSRFISIAQKHTYGSLVRLTADNPIVDIKILDQTIDCHLKNKNDYTNTTNLPVGMNFEVISAATLLSMREEQLSNADKEHVTLYIKNNDRYVKMNYDPGLSNYLKKIRLTVDYPSDLLLVSTVLSCYKNSDSDFGIQLVEKVYSQFPFVFEANENNFQKKQFNNRRDELAHAILLLRSIDLEQAASIIEKNEHEDTV